MPLFLTYQRAFAINFSNFMFTLNVEEFTRKKFINYSILEELFGILTNRSFFKIEKLSFLWFYVLKLTFSSWKGGKIMLCLACKLLWKVLDDSRSREKFQKCHNSSFYLRSIHSWTQTSFCILRMTFFFNKSDDHLGKMSNENY